MVLLRYIVALLRGIGYCTSPVHSRIVLAVGDGIHATHCCTTWWHLTGEVLRDTATLPKGGRELKISIIVLHYLGVVGDGICTPPGPVASRNGTAELHEGVVALPRGCLQWNCPLTCYTNLGQSELQLLRCTAAPFGGSLLRNSCGTLSHCPQAIGNGFPAVHAALA